MFKQENVTILSYPVTALWGFTHKKINAEISNRIKYSEISSNDGALLTYTY